LSTPPVVASAALNPFSERKSARDAAELAHRRVVERARQPVFFTDYGVPDTLDGRFELICLHAFLYLHCLKAFRPQGNRLCQSFLDRTFADFDRAVRELGAGDLSVGKQVKRMAQAFYGRIRAYEEGLAGDKAALRAALSRNLFGTVPARRRCAGMMAEYVRNAAGELRAQSAAELLAGCIFVGVPPAAVTADVCGGLP
jgi:cytochrome b pre-mRNA-processing protein 3